MVLGIGNLVSAIDILVRDGGVRVDDSIDRMNYMIMSGLLLCLAVASGSRQYVGTAIYCWAPAEFSMKYHRRYVNNFCWVNSVYSVPFDDPVPTVEEDRYFNDVSYYKLATVLFLMLAVLFRIPHLFWNVLKRISGDNLDELVGLTSQTAIMDQEQRNEQLSRVAELFHRWISSRQFPTRRGNEGCFQQTLSRVKFGGHSSGHRLPTIFLLIKYLYLLNIVGQFFIISAFLQTDFWTLGLAAASSYLRHGQWEDIYNFPRVVHCDFKIRQTENVHTYTIQCVLAINAFLEKMFLLLWICLMIMMVANTISCIRWTFELLHGARTLRFLEKYFGQFLSEKSDKCGRECKKDLTHFRRYLQADGVFVIRMIALNTTGMLACDLVRHIWTKYSGSQDVEAQTIEEEGGKNTNNAVPIMSRSLIHV